MPQPPRASPSANSKTPIILSICIPTHDGRARVLSELLTSIFRQIDLSLSDMVEICISDNGSQDGTQDTVASAEKESPCKLRYYRFEQNEGLRNFQNVMAMASGVYCWMIGSDDMLPPGSIRRIVDLLKKHEGMPGFTLNKLNFNSDYSAFVGPDNEVVLPSNWPQERILSGFNSIVLEMYFLLSFISAHVLKKAEWDAAFDAMGWNTFLRMRHFAFSAVLAKIIQKADEWRWVPDFLITQRLGNSCLVEDFGDFGYAMQCTEDMRSFIDYILLGMHNTEQVRATLLRKMFLLYWNPILILKYKSGSKTGNKFDIRMLRFCVKSLYRLPLFWLTSFFVLLLPAQLAPLLQTQSNRILTRVRQRQLQKARASYGDEIDRTVSEVVNLARSMRTKRT